MARFVGFLRGVTPQNLKMADLRLCVEAAGFADARTVLTTGNVAFDTDDRDIAAIEYRLEQAFEARLGRCFRTTVRSSTYLQEIVASNPFPEDALASGAKPVITFLYKAPETRPDLPIERDAVRILELTGTEVFTIYQPSEKGPVFMSLLERTFGKTITTRTFETVKKCARA